MTSTSQNGAKKGKPRPEFKEIIKGLKRLEKMAATVK